MKHNKTKRVSRRKLRLAKEVLGYMDRESAAIVAIKDLRVSYIRLAEISERVEVEGLTQEILDDAADVIRLARGARERILRSISTDHHPDSHQVAYLIADSMSDLKQRLWEHEFTYRIYLNRLEDAIILFTEQMHETQAKLESYSTIA